MWSPPFQLGGCPSFNGVLTETIKTNDRIGTTLTSKSSKYAFRGTFPHRTLLHGVTVQTAAASRFNGISFVSCRASIACTRVSSVAVFKTYMRATKTQNNSQVSHWISYFINQLSNTKKLERSWVWHRNAKKAARLFGCVCSWPLWTSLSRRTVSIFYVQYLERTGPFPPWGKISNSSALSFYWWEGMPKSDPKHLVIDLEVSGIIADK